MNRSGQMISRALVTGASGFIGSHLVKTLISKNWSVTCLARPSSRMSQIESLPISILRGSSEDTELLEKAVRDQDYVFHLAGRIRSAPKRIYDEANHQFTKNLAHACIKTNVSVNRFLYVSSIAAAGPSENRTYLNEDHPPQPASEYGRSKLRAEKALYNIWNKLPVTIIRPPNVYGPRQQETELFIKLLQKRFFPLLRDKEKRTSLIYVKDLVDGICQAALAPNTDHQIYYLTDGQGYSWRQILLTLRKHTLGKKFVVPIPEEAIRFAAWMTDIIKSTGLIRPFFGRKAWYAMVKTTWLYSSEKARKDFNFAAQYSLDEGIRETAAYYAQASSEKFS